MVGPSRRRLRSFCQIFTAGMEIHCKTDGIYSSPVISVGMRAFLWISIGMFVYVYSKCKTYI